MPKFRIVYGIAREDDYEDIVEAKDLEEARQKAYYQALELFHSEATYDAEEINEEDEDA